MRRGVWRGNPALSHQLNGCCDAGQWQMRAGALYCGKPRCMEVWLRDRGSSRPQPEVRDTGIDYSVEGMCCFWSTCNRRKRRDQALNLCPFFYTWICRIDRLPKSNLANSGKRDRVEAGMGFRHGGNLCLGNKPRCSVIRCVWLLIDQTIMGFPQCLSRAS